MQGELSLSLIHATPQTPLLPTTDFVPGSCDPTAPGPDGEGDPDSAASVFSQGVRGCLQHPIERMAFERIAEFQINVEHRVAFMAAELFEAGRIYAARHAGAQRAALEAVAAEQRGVETGAGGAAMNDPGHGAGVDRHGADAGQGGIAAVAAARRILIRRNTAPSVIPAASCQARSAQIGQRSVAPLSILV
jgi:hypothetical protein